MAQRSLEYAPADELHLIPESVSITDNHSKWGWSKFEYAHLSPSDLKPYTWFLNPHPYRLVCTNVYKEPVISVFRMDYVIIDRECFDVHSCPCESSSVCVLCPSECRFDLEWSQLKSRRLIRSY